MTVKSKEKHTRIKFERHISILIWKSYLQRQRKWRILLGEAMFSAVLFLIAIFLAKPIFLTPLQAVPEPPLMTDDILQSLNKRNILGFAPNGEPYSTIMSDAAEKLGIEIMSAPTEDDLNNILYNRSRGSPIQNPVIWIIWKPKHDNTWRYSIRSTEQARYATGTEYSATNPHLRSGVLAVQLAVNQAILSYVSNRNTRYELVEAIVMLITIDLLMAVDSMVLTVGKAPVTLLGLPVSIWRWILLTLRGAICLFAKGGIKKLLQLSLASMPVSPLMQQERVRRAISAILLCFTLALLPPVLETEWLVVTETINSFKRSLRIRGVDYSSMYIGWLVYAYLTALPVCLLASITLILIFRWIHLLFTLILVLAYLSVMIMLAFIMSMFHNDPWIACVWSTLFTLLQTFLAELIVHHQVDLTHDVITFFLHLIIPPLGLMHGLSEFALLQTGQEGRWKGNSIIFTILSWVLMIVLYFGLLMILQRTIKQRTIGGQISWRSIFKKAEYKNNMYQVETPTGKERDKLQEVDELVAKAISFRNVTKSFLSGQVIENITFDIYRCEFTLLYSEPIQAEMVTTIEDLLTGLTYPDKGYINVLGNETKPEQSFISVVNMLGYCHRKGCLIDDFTVQETLTFYCFICLWNESTDYITEYVHIRSTYLLAECDLDGVRHEYVRNLGMYYRAQLCWAIAILLEPRIVLIPTFTSHSVYTAVIRHKIMQYKKHITIVNLCYTSIALEYADRVFIFDHRILVFGGTPAYMFLKYGREYRVRLTLRNDRRSKEDVIRELLNITSESGATVRAHLGSLLILRLPTQPTEKVAALVKELSEISNIYGIISMNISVPDSEEVCNRAVYESRASTHGTIEEHEITRNALSNLSQPVVWKRHKSKYSDFTNLAYIGWKFLSFYGHHKLTLLMTIASALITGIFIGLSLSTVLSEMETDRATKSLMHGAVLTVEALEQKTNLVLRCDSSPEARAIANSYVFSETNATEKEVENMMYTALMYPESLTEYLVTRAIDSPQLYVYLFAYGLDVALKNNTINLQVLYSPLHYDHGAAARSLSRAFMALVRHYTGYLDSTIQVTDDPLALDLTTWLKTASAPPVFVQFLLILTISHITVLPSKESGLIRHMQVHAMNFSPARYWCHLFLCDFMLYVALVALMSVAMVVIMVLIAPMTFYYSDLLVVPIMLTVYGIGCIPQAYLFSLGPKVALNTMTFVILNIVFGESTIMAKILYGNTLDYVMNFMVLSPQFNMAYAFIKIKKIFLYNSECIIFQRKNLCSSNTFHKCCPKCGVLQECFSRQLYLSQNNGVIMEIIATLCTAVIFMTLLLLWEYKCIQRVWTCAFSKWIYPNKSPTEVTSEGARKEKERATLKHFDLMQHEYKTDTFGGSLLAYDVSRGRYGENYINNVYLGVQKGEALAVSGLIEHGRLRLCRILAGYDLPSEGDLWAMSKWRLNRDPHRYATHVTLSHGRVSLPYWMSVRRALLMLAALRGVPRKYLDREVKDYVDSLEIHNQLDTLVKDLSATELGRLNFAAAVVGAPTTVVLDECTAYQKYSVRRAMYSILDNLVKRGHSVIISSSSVESHLPITNRLAIIVNGRIFDVGTVDELVLRYSDKGYTVVIQVEENFNIMYLLSIYFKTIVVNDATEVLVNVQILDADLTWGSIFHKMETLKSQSENVYSYVISATPIDYIYNSIVSYESGKATVTEIQCCKYFFSQKSITPTQNKLDNLLSFEKKFNVTKLKALPWSVIFKDNKI